MTDTSSPLAKKNKTSHDEDEIGSMVAVPSTPVQGASSAARQLEELNLVSFNMAGCQPSKEAPSEWTKQDSIDAMHDAVVQNNPDILFLQECPGDIVWATRVFPGYRAVGNTQSHADQVVLMVRNGISARLISPIESDEFRAPIPMVVAELTSSSGERTLWVASMHLAPFESNSLQRKDQVRGLLQAAGSTPVLFAGDTNMREFEDETMESELGLLDVWKAAGSSEDTKWTWDTMDHGATFNRYYGETTRQYTARYDRVYFSGGGSAASSPSFSVYSFDLMGNQPLRNPYHFLSDHFGIESTVGLRWPDREYS